MIHTWIMQFQELFHLLVSDLDYRQYLWCSCWKPAIRAWFWELFHSDSMSIDRSANWRPGGDRAPNTASFPYCTLSSYKPTCWLEYKDTHAILYTGYSVSNGSGPSLRVRVRVQTEPLPNWESGSSIYPNCARRYGSMVNSQPVWIGQVVSGSPSGSIYRFI